MNKSLLARLRTSLAALPAMAAGAAHAHHPMDGAMPATLVEGLLSGVGHPVIEPGHLLFLLGAAVLVAVCDFPPRRAIGSLALLLLASLAGTLAGSIAGVPAAVELAVGGTLVALAVALWLRRYPGGLAAMLLPVCAGAIHGLAYAEAVIGAEPAPVLAYLAGLGLVQAAMLVPAWMLAHRLPGFDLRARGARWASAATTVAALVVFFPPS